ncbi:MAG: HAD family hydrolase [Chloroflexia bacterium]|nr:HAD family hydrolase [Chloroflexia bacterium]
MENDRLQQIRHLLADMDGVIYSGEQALPGAADLVRWLEEQGIGLLYITNNSTRTPQQYVQKLAGLGIAARAEQILTSSLATRAYLERAAPRCTGLYLIGEDGLRQALLGDGYFQVEETRPAYVVVGMDHQLNYDKLRRATLAIRAGARFIGSNPDRTFPTPEGIIPGAGANLAALEAATDVRPTIIGKPERWMMEEAMRRLGAEAPHCAVLGDRLETDILGGKRLGLVTLMVLTGVHGREDIAGSEVQPDFVFESLVALKQAWEKARPESKRPGAKKGGDRAPDD